MRNEMKNVFWDVTLHQYFGGTAHIFRVAFFNPEDK
jgi:hypothetical protein